MSFLFGRSRVSPLEDAAGLLHDSLIAQIRRPVFYTSFLVPDTFEGRFDLLVLHVALVLRRLRSLGPEGQALAQPLVDTMFRRFDIALRELGVSDVAVPKRMKRLAEAFKGRTAAYDEALATPDRAGLRMAVARNVLNDTADGERLARYALALEAALEVAPLTTLQTGVLTCPDPAEAGRTQE